MNTFTKGQKVTTTAVKELEGKVLTVKTYLPKIKAYQVTDGKMNWSLQEQDLELVTEEITIKKEVQAVKEVVVKETSKIKLTKAQQKVIDDIKAANYSYVTKDNCSIDNLYIDGKPFESNGTYITDDGNYRVKLNTKTLDVLVKNGLLEVIDLVGDGFDTVRTFETFEKPYKYDKLSIIELRKIVNHETGGYFKQMLSCPVGQEEVTIQASKLLEEGFKVFNTEVKEVKAW